VAVGGGGGEEGVAFAGGDLQEGGDFVGDGVDVEEFVLPAEEAAGEVGEVADAGWVFGSGGFGEGVAEGLLDGGVVVGFELDLGVDEGDGFDDDADGLEVGEPCLVFGNGLVAGIGHAPAAGGGGEAHGREDFKFRISNFKNGAWEFQNSKNAANL